MGRSVYRNTGYPDITYDRILGILVYGLPGYQDSMTIGILITRIPICHLYGFSGFLL